MVDFPKNLLIDLARRRCVIVVGSGVSAQAKSDKGESPPTWKHFLQQCNDELDKRGIKKDSEIQDAINKNDLLHACEWLQKKYETNWKDKLREVFTAPRFHHSRLHEIIARLDTRIVFSLNFDNILDRAFSKIQEGTTIVKRYYDEDCVEFLRGTGRYLIKVHGDLDAPEKIIFTQKQYSEARIKASNFYNAFDGTLLTHTFLFLGCGVTDPDINLILENQNFSYSGVHPHYLLSPKNEIHPQLKVSLKDNRNLKVIEYDKIDDNYSGFSAVLEELLAQVEDYRLQPTVINDW